MDRKTKKVIFIGGSSYSGSTMLDMMMANSPDGFSVGEVHALFNPYRPHHFKPVCGCGSPDCDFWVKAREAGETNLYKMIFCQLSYVKFIVDSSKNPWWIKKQSLLLDRQDIEVYHLLIWKKPAQFAQSMLKRNRKGWEKSWINYYRLYISLINDFQVVSYNELCKNSAYTLQKISKNFGLEYINKKENFWEKKHHTLFGNDSAKIHLKRKIKENKKKGDNKTALPHRTIYCDNSYLEKLPHHMLKNIEKNKKLNHLIEILNDNADQEVIKNYIFSEKQLLIINLCRMLKLAVGKSIGRYFRIF